MKLSKCFRKKRGPSEKELLLALIEVESKLVQELVNLQTAIAALTTAVQAVVAKLGQPSIAPSDVQAAADAVNAAVSSLNAALAPPGS